jgi:hypothetical protein
MDQETTVQEKPSATRADASLSQPKWHLLFMLIGVAFLLPIGILVRLALGLSAVDDRVFAVEALASGLLAELVIRRLWRRRLILFEKAPVPFLLVWVALCAYVFIARPLE